MENKKELSEKEHGEKRCFGDVFVNKGLETTGPKIFVYEGSDSDKV